MEKRSRGLTRVQVRQIVKINCQLEEKNRNKHTAAGRTCLQTSKTVKETQKRKGTNRRGKAKGQEVTNTIEHGEESEVEEGDRVPLSLLALTTLATQRWTLRKATMRPLFSLKLA